MVDEKGEGTFFELFNQHAVEIQAKRDRLIDELEQQLGQQVDERSVLCCEWILA